MKKIIKAVSALLVFFLMFALTSCGDDAQKRLIGTWKQNPGDAKSLFGIDPVSHYYTFNSDGTYVETGMENFAGKTYDTKRTGKYKIDKEDDLLKLYPDDGWHDDTFGDQEFAYHYTVTNDYLTITTGLGTENYTKQN